MEILCNIIQVFNVMSDQFNAFMLKKSILKKIQINRINYNGSIYIYLYILRQLLLLLKRLNCPVTLQCCS